MNQVLRRFFIALFCLGLSPALFAQNYNQSLSGCATTTNGQFTLTFTNAGTPSGAGLLDLTQFWGDFSATGEFFQVFDENGNQIGTNYSSNTDCSSTGSAQIVLSQADLLLWAADGIISFTASAQNATTSVNNFCFCANPGSTGGTSSFTVDMTLDYPQVTGPNNIGVLSIDTPNVFCSGPQDLVVTVANYGTNQVDTFTVIHTINGGTPVIDVYTNILLDTANGTGPNTVQLNLATYTINSPTNIVVYTSMPNTVMDTVNANDTATKIATPALNGMFTIDPAGAGPNNYTDFTTAVSDLHTFGVCGPVTFTVADSVYDERLDFTGNIPGISATNNVSFVSASGNPQACRVEYSSASAQYEAVVKFDQGDRHISFTNIKFYNTISTSTFSNVVSFGGEADSIHFDGCIFENDITTTTQIQASLVHKDNFKSVDVTFTNCTFLKGSYGAYWDGNSSNYDDRTVFSNCLFQDQYFRGLYMYYQDEPTVNENTVFSNTSYTSGYGMWLYFFTGADVQVKNNHIYQDGTSLWPRYGMYIVSWTGDLNLRADVSGNVISMPNGGTYGLYMSNDLFVDVANNSILFADPSTTDEAVYITGGAVNRFYNNAVEAGNSALTMFVSGNAIETSDNNAFTGNTGFSWNGTHPDLASLVAATEMDSNSVMLSTIFTDSMALLVCNDTLNAAGIDNPYYMADMQGDPTVAGAYDIGADQFETSNTFNLRDTVGLCSGGIVTLEAWYFDTIVWNNSDTGNMYQTSLLGAVTVSASGLCGTALDTVQIEPAVDVNLPASSVICLANSATIDAGISNASYMWSTGEMTQSIQITSPGTYSVTVTDQDGCVSDDQTVASFNVPVDLSEEEVLCEGGSVTLDAGISGGTYSWSTGDATQTISVSTPGAVDVTVTDAAGCVSQDSTMVTEVLFPTADFSSVTLTFGVTFTNGSANGDDYLWLFGDGDSSTVENPSHVYPWTNQDTSAYTVTLITTNACGSDTSIQEVLIGNLVSVQEIAGSGSMKVYPNPASDVVWLDFTKIETQSPAVNVLITDIQGKVVLDREVGMTGGVQVEQLDISNLVSGVYIIAVSNEEFSFNHQLVVQ